MLADPTLLYVMLVLFFATLIRSTLGFGEALVAVPLLALRMPVMVATPLAVMASVLVAGTIVVQDWRKIEVRSAGGLLLASLLGLPVGLWLLTHCNDQVVRMSLGVLLLAFSLYSLMAGSRLHLEKDHPLWLLGAGVCSGILGGAYGMNGPPLAIYGALRRWSPSQFRATLQGYFLPASLVGLVGYASLGLVDRVVGWYFLCALPGMAAAIFLGRAINHRLRGEWFFKAVYAGLLVIAGLLLAEALGGG